MSTCSCKPSQPCHHQHGINRPRPTSFTNLDPADRIRFADADFEEQIKGNNLNDVYKVVLKSEAPVTRSPDIGVLEDIKGIILPYMVTSYENGKPVFSKEVWPKHTREDRRVCKDASILSWNLPGHGKISKPGICDRGQGVVGCAHAHIIAHKHWYCDNPNCPYCFPHWTITKAYDAYKRLKAVHDLYAIYGCNRQLSHVVISAPEDYYSLIGDKQGFDWLIEIFTRMSASFDIDGEMIFHPWRGSNDDKADLDAKLSLDFIEGYWREGPHVHIIGYCDPDFIKQNSAKCYRETGFVVKVIHHAREELHDGQRPFDLDAAKDAIAYALSHVGIGCFVDDSNKRNIRAIREVGEYSSHSKKRGLAVVDKIKEDIPLRCSECEECIYSEADLNQTYMLGSTPHYPEDAIPEKIVAEHIIFTTREYAQVLKLSTRFLSPSETCEFCRRHPEIPTI